MRRIQKNEKLNRRVLFMREGLVPVELVEGREPAATGVRLNVSGACPEITLR